MNNLEIIKYIRGKIQPSQQWIMDNCIFLHKGGSHLYGTNTASSDIDLRGVTVAPKEYWVGLPKFDQFEYTSEKYDVVIYDVRKWLNLCYGINPNVIESLFVPRNSTYVVMEDKNKWNKIISHTNDFLNNRAYTAFMGYSTSQLKKLQTKQDNKSGRQHLIEKYGFDSKFSSHGFRLARQGVELLTKGKITFPRPDRKELLDIIEGRKYKKEDFDKMVKDLEHEHTLLREAKEKSILPEKGNYEALNQLHIDIFDEWVNI